MPFRSAGVKIRKRRFCSTITNFYVIYPLAKTIHQKSLMPSTLAFKKKKKRYKIFNLYNRVLQIRHTLYNRRMKPPPSQKRKKNCGYAPEGGEVDSYLHSFSTLALNTVSRQPIPRLLSSQKTVTDSHLDR